MRRTLLYGTVVLATLQMLGAHALDCPAGTIKCIHDNDQTEFCSELQDALMSCPEGSSPDPTLGTPVPTCGSGEVPCAHDNDGHYFCYSGFLCPAGSTQLGPITIPECPNPRQVRCVFGPASYCFDYACPPGMQQVGSTDCGVAPVDCPASQKLCLYDIGNGFACQSSELACWPGTHEWKSCVPKLDFTTGQILLKNGHYIKCLTGLRTLANGNVYCGLPMFNQLTVPTNYADGKLLYIYFCNNADNSLTRHLLPLARDLGFSTVTGDFSFDSMGPVPQSWYNSGFYTGQFYSEYCYADGEVLLWTNPKCQPQFPNINGNCFASRFTLVK